MRALIRYRLKAEQLQRNRKLLDAVYDELQAASPQDLRYATFVLDDGVSFLAFVEADGPERFAQLESFRAYRAELDERCDEPPSVTLLRDVRCYRFPARPDRRPAARPDR